MLTHTTLYARALADQTGAQFAVCPGAAYDMTDSRLGVVAEALIATLAGTGVEVVTLMRVDTTLVACLDETESPEPVCPAAFNRLVHRLSHALLGEVWEAKLQLVPSAPIPASLGQVA